MYVYGIVLNILRVFRSGTRLKVYRALDIQKRFGHPMGSMCQQLSVLWTNKKKIENV